MPSYKRPGVFVEETLTPAQARANGGGSTAVFVGAYGRGLTSPVFVSSYTEFANKYGPLDATYDLGFGVFTFFGNGGSGCWITRAVGSGATAASLDLSDRALTPDPTLRATAVSVGGWGNTLYTAIVDTGVAGRFDLAIYSGGTAAANIVESYTDLAMDPTDPRYVVSLVNSQSEYLHLTDLASASASPNNVPSARVASDVNAVLSGGADGSAPDASDHLDAVETLDVVEGPLVLNLPGVSTTATLDPIISYAENRGDVYVVMDSAANRTPSQVVSDSAPATASSYAAVYYPRIKIPDPIATTPGVLRTVPVGGAVVGQFMRTDADIGPFHAPAGVRAGLLPAADVERKLTPSDLDMLNTSTPPINAIRSVPGSGICIMGARTLKPGYADKYVPVRRSLIYIRKNLIDLTQFAVFEPNDQRLWERIAVTCTAFLRQYYQRGGLRGASAAQAFYVTCDSSINTQASVAAGAVNVEVGVAVQYPAEFVVIRLGQFEGGAAIVEVQ